MERASVFTSLPSELISLLVSDWLDWRDVGHLDSAVCNKTEREEWLNLLRTHCVFHSISRVFANYPRFLHWVISRCIRVQDVFIGMSLLLNNETATKWFQHTASFLTTLTFHQIRDVAKETIARCCSKLLVLHVETCFVEDTFWEIQEILQNNPNLQELRMHTNVGINTSARPAKYRALPKELTLPHLQRLEISGEFFNSENAVLLLHQLPSLRSIKINQRLITVANNSLPAVSLPSLVHLHLECKVHSINDFCDKKFVHVLKSLQTGLRALILPAKHFFAPVELLSITQYHGHSLRCLSIQNDMDWTAEYKNIDFAEQLNRMPQLHTLRMRYKTLSTLLSPITNPSITHLYMDLPSSSLSISDILSTHCPGLNTLSLFYPPSLSLAEKSGLQPRLFHKMNVNALVTEVVSDIMRLLELRPLISTLCVNNDDVLLGLRTNFPHINVVKYVAIDIFATDY